MQKAEMFANGHWARLRACALFSLAYRGYSENKYKYSLKPIFALIIAVIF